MKDQEFDALFKEALELQNSAPPEHIWRNIAREIPYKEKQLFIRKGVFWKGIAAAALLGGMTLAIMQNTMLKDQDSELLYAIHPIQLNDRNQLIPQLSSTIELPPIIVREKETKTYDRIDILSSNVSLASTIDTDRSIANQQLTIEEQNLLFPIVDGEYLRVLEQYNETLENEGSSQSKQTNQVKEQIIVNEKQPLQVELAGVVSPTYSSSSYRSDLKSTRGVPYQEENMNANFKLGGGLKVAFHRKGRLSFQTGVSYNQISHSTIENGIMYPQTTSSNMNSRGAKKVVINSSLGAIKSDLPIEIPVNEGVIPTGVSKYSYESILSQEFSTIDIPIHIRYRLTGGSLMIHVSGGVSGSILTENRAYIDHNATKSYLGKTDGIRPVNLTADMGLVIEYPIFNRVNLFAEPGFRYYVNSFSKNSDIVFKPYSLSVSTGIGITF